MMITGTQPGPLLEAVLTAWRQRRQLRHLLGYSDQTLADIGLYRADIELALQAPLRAAVFEQLALLYRRRRHFS